MPPKCQVCGQEFKVAESLTKHMKKVHFISASLPSETTTVYEVVVGAVTTDDDLEGMLKYIRSVLENMRNKESVYLEITRKDLTK